MKSMSYGLFRDDDFTFVDDIAAGTVRVLDHVPVGQSATGLAHPDPGKSCAPYRVYNIGNHQPVELLAFVETLELALGRKAIKQLMPMQPGDVEATFADIEDLRRDVGFEPSVGLSEGLQRWADWYSVYLTGRHKP